MSLRDYEKPHDMFELGDGRHYGNGFDFPCCVCKHVVKIAMEKPCINCGHNVNAVLLDAKARNGGKI